MGNRGLATDKGAAPECRPAPPVDAAAVDAASPRRSGSVPAASALAATISTRTSFLDATAAAPAAATGAQLRSESMQRRLSRSRTRVVESLVRQFETGIESGEDEAADGDGVAAETDEPTTRPSLVRSSHPLIAKGYDHKARRHTSSTR